MAGTASTLRGVLAATLAIALVLSSAARAGALSVLPILIEGDSRTTLTLKNQDSRPLNIQIRVFKWTQVDGEDRLEPTDEVVVSPPIVAVAPNQDYVVRLQRMSSEPPAQEEAYRVVVDQLPNPNRQRNGTVEVVLRFLVPAFFGSPDESQPRLRWALETRGGRRVLVAENSGDRRVQLTNLALKKGNRVVSVQKGLAGYVLGHSEKVWPVPANVAGGAGTSVISMSDRGAINAALPP
ncbi:fimbrial biogenesis chaperone [Methylovirgula sp. 4M-Z18]|uniref:fimbrial biogenesis chaperone n=1 Tax=Methylovirgula sp. 4M-Z18 TaxID=2293567 RepID=UPI000E2FC6D7|nr:molecular chaperone [Methylovirgula sp. 4M-Z18]RFB79443.1 molecular chaperone [Methylovirgula sp. 4M-Z18]